ncbi:uncharacterized protein UV8b_03612 [Ustilaginoidea virens]|uniref:Uncharacterized protein n=1 Tax=Ustilaginoidea virens TaxID=1159556 RepID=A0A8E5MH72_USTVR|nr:uncharacterized protein UV8b_03612 [Ustilaginoidea virens]QUC19371.1 hypothetical protein UV8b_03612 [Ustilaginoidea virens]
MASSRHRCGQTLFGPRLVPMSSSRRTLHKGAIDASRDRGDSEQQSRPAWTSDPAFNRLFKT